MVLRISQLRLQNATDKSVRNNNFGESEIMLFADRSLLLHNFGK